MTDASDPAAEVQERNVAPLPVEHRFAVRANRWAIIVGISEYEDARLNLTWANRDAQKLYELIQTPAGGGFEPERIELLIDGKATTAAVTRALRTFLKKPAREDVVLLYFACHGTPDIDRPNTTYLLTHDTDPDDVSGTALPMREIDISLRENLLAEKVVIIADTCHSASIGNAGGRRDAGNDAGAINAYLEKVSEARDGVALLTSAESNETAREGTQWGKGHGVFTYFLLRGLRGEADGYGRPKDGVVSVGELFDYVRDNVKRATDDQQHPAIGTTPFDRNLPMAITGGVSAREHLELGRRLLELGRRLDERERYLAAASRFAEAVSLSGMAQAPLPEASLGLGHALLAAGEPQRCTQALQPLVADPPPAGVEEALLVNGIAHAKLGDAPSARASFERFIAASPAHEYAAWARGYLKRPQEAPGRRLSLLIGIDQYLEGPALTLRGCVNDVRIMERALFGEQGAAAGEVVTVTDALATKNGIARAFADLAVRAGPADTVFVHYSGHSVPDRMDEDSKVEDTYLLVHDTVDSELGVSAAELHEWLQAIPSQHTTIVLDTHPRRAFMELAEREGDYHVMIASDSAQMAYETRVQIDGELVTAGSFTSALAGQFADSDPATLTFGGLLDGVIHRLEGVAGPETPPPADSPIDWPESTHQVPVLIGERDDLVFGVSDEHLWAYDFTLRRTYPRESVARLRTLRRHVPSDLAESLPALDVSFGRAFVEHHGYDEAIDTLDSVVDRAGPRAAEGLRLLAAARLGAHRLVDAAPAFEALATRVERAEVRTALGTQAAALGEPRQFALLVGIDRYRNEGLKRPRGAVHDVRLVRTALIERCGFADEDVSVLVDEEASRTSILNAFRKLAELGRTDPAVFFFAGNGSTDSSGNPTLVSADGRTGEVFDIGLDELAGIARESDAANLISIIDASFIGEVASDGGRSLDADPRPQPSLRQSSGASHLAELFGAQPSVDVSNAPIGSVNIYNERAVATPLGNAAAAFVMEGEWPGILRRKRGVHGHLTYTLVRALAEVDAPRLTYGHWLESARDSTGSLPIAVAAPNRLDQPVFENHRLRESALATLLRLELEPIEEAVGMLRRLIDERQQQGDQDPAGRLDLGIACAETGDFTAAVDALERAVSLYRAASTLERERDPHVDDHLREAHYQLGRVLYESRTDFTKAVSELDRAVALDPDNARAHYYLGQAIRQMVERETLAKATTALRRYLTMGAPLGDEDEVREFLGARTSRAQGDVLLPRR